MSVTCVIHLSGYEMYLQSRVMQKEKAIHKGYLKYLQAGVQLKNLSFLKQGISMYYVHGCPRTYYIDRLALNSQRFTRLCFQSDGAKGISHHTQRYHSIQRLCLIGTKPAMLPGISHIHTHSPEVMETFYRWQTSQWGLLTVDLRSSLFMHQKF